jgi:hypothetical protein
VPAPDAVLQNMGATSVGILVATLVMPLHEQARAAVAGPVAVEDDAPAPCSVEPIPSWRWVDFLHPFRQRPWVSCTGARHQRVMPVTFPARSSSALSVKSLV